MNPLSFISRLLASPASASQGDGTVGWTLFDNAEAPPSTVPPFRLRIPPGFVAVQPETPAEPGSLLVTLGEFRLSERSGRVASLTVGIVNAPGGKATRGGNDVLEHWDRVGNEMAKGNGATFDGARQFVFRGSPSADLYYSGIPGPHLQGGMTVFGAVRAVIAGDAHLLLGSFAGFPAAEAAALNYSSRDNPFLLASFLPFADSLEFKSKSP
ncbi:MAG: hypothetical protein LBT40_18485 [Deltaproteobacteria bacterium]|jgi:hypothetical protein|nr:hypothetical protein [Deltaproteobacteria bacterium]